MYEADFVNPQTICFENSRFYIMKHNVLVYVCGVCI